MIKKLVVWGGTVGLESHRHIHRAFFNTARKTGIAAVWVADSPDSVEHLTPGAVVLSADIYGHHLVSRPGVRYVLHNFDGSSQLCQQLAEEQILRLQVWTTDATGEEWDKCRQYDRAARTLFQPWGTDLLAEEFMEPVFNQMSREVVFVGAVWGEKSPYGELGNISMIEELKQVCQAHGLTFRHLTHVSDTENIDAVRSGRLAPAVAGAWQVEHGYLPCRIFKNISYGALGFTNVSQAAQLVGNNQNLPLSYVLDSALRLKGHQYTEKVREQQRIVARYTYRESLAAIERAFES